jgi:hypothetical protein
MPAPQLPVSPLREWIGALGGIRPLLAAADLSSTEYARLHRAWFRADKRGFITHDAADNICVHLLRQHPMVVWGEDWIVDMLDIEDATSETVSDHDDVVVV